MKRLILAVTILLAFSTTAFAAKQVTLTTTEPTEITFRVVKRMVNVGTADEPTWKEVKTLHVTITYKVYDSNGNYVRDESVQANWKNLPQAVRDNLEPALRWLVKKGNERVINETGLDTLPKIE
jgi:hypothetical protein